MAAVSCRSYERGNPKEWIYCRYDPRPRHDKAQYTLQKFARNQRSKLYSDGRLFDIPKDVLEKHPLTQVRHDFRDELGLSPGEGGEEAARDRLGTGGS